MIITNFNLLVCSKQLKKIMNTGILTALKKQKNCIGGKLYNQKQTIDFK